MTPPSRLGTLLLRLGKGWAEALIIGVSVGGSLLFTTLAYRAAAIHDASWRFAIAIAVLVPLLVATPVAFTVMSLLRQLARARDDAYQLANTDLLTGLSNRRRWIEVAEAELQRSAGPQLPLALLMLDIDHFKRVNDIYGHGAGDAVLRAVADVCREVLRPVDVVARWGGEEFVALLPGIGRDAGVQIAERVRARVVESRVRSGNRHVPATVSIGVVGTREDGAGHDLDRLLHLADAAMYAAKQAGRNRVEITPRGGPDFGSTARISKLIPS